MNLILEPIGNKYSVVKEYTYKDVTVPIGFLTDGISYIFRIFGVFINRFDPRYIEAVVVHDLLASRGEWEKANRYFEEMLPDDGRGKSMVKGVKLYAFFKVDVLEKIKGWF